MDHLTNGESPMTFADGCAGSLAEIGDGRETVDLSPLEAALKCRDQGEPAALVTIIGASGSAPRSMGSLMAVRKDGSIIGTVGGGNLELFAIRHALASLKDGRPRRLHYDFSGGTGQNVEKPCCGTTDFFIQPILETPRLVIFGAGHVGRALAPLALSCGFAVTVADDRPEYLDAARFPAGVGFQCGPFSETAAAIPFDGATYAVIMTYGHIHDETALGACLERPWRYLGLVGSRAKVATLKECLGTTAAAREKLARIHAPVGLDLGGRTPAEIAVAIMSEILAVRHGRENVRSLAVAGSRDGGTGEPGKEHDTVS
ncbi:MAG: XdhC/CoxI family protein [PVC group bacterium]